ncbi:MAG: hypothetical protein B7X54_04400 [Idiomarina sp. 34-48-12]|nr:MAG: hypothetical protein B7X54_04400 [Idiomarina sp. 34-48-12]
MRKLMNATSVLIALFFIGACGSTAPIMNVDNAIIIGDLNKQQVRIAIIKAATNRGWIIADRDENEMRATITLRSHKAEVRIPYSQKNYSIVFVNATNLDHGNGRIHANYNRWINNLNTDIRRYMQLEHLSN